MFGGGSIQGMINSLNNNKKLLRSNRLFTKERSFLNLKKEDFKAANGKKNYKKASKEDILKIRKKVIKERKKENLLLISVTIIILSIFSFFTFKLIEQNNRIVEKQKNVRLKEKEAKFLFFIENGDEWFKKAKWNNSIFYYKKAKNIFPNNYDINFRLANSYSLQCQIDLKNCYEAKVLLNNLLVKFPHKKKELHEIKERLKYEY